MVDEQQYRALLELVRKVRHDANNPITAALGHVRLLLDDPDAEPEAQRESLRVIETELRRITEIVRRLNQIDDDGL